MKRLVSVLLFAVMILLCIPLTTFSINKDISVYYQGKAIDFPVTPQNMNGCVMVPMRGILEALDYQVTWNPAARTITAEKTITSIIFTVGKQTAVVNNEEIKLVGPVRIFNGSALIPLRFILEISDKDVLWNGSTQTVYIEDRNPNEYASIENIGRSIACGVGNRLIYMDMDDSSFPDCYMTTFDGNASTRLVDGSNYGIFNPLNFQLSPIDNNKMILYENYNFYMIDVNSKTDKYPTYNKIFNNCVNMIHKVYDGNLYYTENYLLYKRNIETGDSEKIVSFNSEDNVLDFEILDNYMFYFDFIDKGVDSYDRSYYLYNFKTGETKKIADNGDYTNLENIQIYQNQFYYCLKNQIYRYNPVTDESTAVSPDDQTIYNFQILNDTIYYQSNDSGCLVLCRSPMDLSYSVKLCSDIDTSWNVVGNHIIYMPSSRSETFIMNTDGTGNVMLRKTGRKYVDLYGNTINDLEGLTN